MFQICRVLEEICRGGSGSVAGQQFLAGALPQLQTLLVTALSSTSPSSQAPRLRCLLSILTQLKVSTSTGNLLSSNPSS
jgi:hypothetical protein